MDNSLLSKRLKELRKIHNFTQDYVAEAIGATRQTYSHYETGRRTPSTETLYKLCGLYNVPVDDLIRLSVNIDRTIYYDAPGPSKSSENLASYLEYFNDPYNRKKYQYNTSLEKELLFYFQKISDYDKREIIEFTKIKAYNKRSQ